MSIEKSEIKIGAAHEIGCRLDDFLDGAVKETQRLEGSSMAFRRAASTIEDVIRSVDRDMDAGGFDLETAKLIKNYVLKAQSMLSQLAAQTENARVAQSGKVQALQMAVQFTKQYKDVEEAKIKAAVREAETVSEDSEETVEALNDSRRTVGTRPKSSVKARRQAEELIKKKSDTSDENSINNSVDVSSEESPSDDDSSTTKKQKRQAWQEPQTDDPEKQTKKE